MAAILIKLSELAIGANAVVRDFPKQDPAFIRLREMGLLVGTSVTLIRTAPLGDPLEIRVRGYNLSIRKADAAHVVVEPAS